VTKWATRSMSLRKVASSIDSPVNSAAWRPSC
jgi:hypothetical protein